MPTADHSTTCVRGQKTICIPCSQEQYEPIVDNPEQFRRLSRCRICGLKGWDLVQSWVTKTGASDLF